MMDCVLTTKDCVLKTRSFAFKMMDFAGETETGGGHARRARTFTSSKVRVFLSFDAVFVLKMISMCKAQGLSANVRRFGRRAEVPGR